MTTQTKTSTEAAPGEGVKRLLVTAPEDRLQRFHAAVCAALLPQSRRGDTVLYTCGSESLGGALAAAQSLRVTVQAVEHVGGRETYRTLVEGEAPEWRPTPAGPGYHVSVSCVECGRIWVEETDNAALLHKSVKCEACG